MMSSYVCRQCRARLFQRASIARNPQWLPKATFVSLRGSLQSSEPPKATTQNEQSPLDPDNTQRSGAIQNDWKEGTHNNPRPGAREGRVGRYSRKVVDLGSYSEGLGEYNEANVEPDASTPPTGQQVDKPKLKSQTFTTPTGQRVENDSNTREIAQSLAADQTGKAWEQFLKTYTTRDCRALVEPSLQDLSFLSNGRFFKRMLSHIVDDFCKGKPGVPSPAAVLLKYQQLDIFRFGRLGMEETDHNRSISSKTAEIGHAWRDTIRFLTHAALLRISGAESGGADTETILTEVLAIWRLLLQCQGSSEIPVESVDTEWSFIPDASTLESAMNPAKPPRDFSKRLEGYHKHLAGNPTLGFSALALFNLLNQRSRNAIPVSETLRTQKEPFVRLLTYILPGSNIQSVFKHVGVAAIFDRIPEDFRTSLLEQISSAPADAMALIGSKEFSEPALSDTERASAQEEYFLKRIERAILQKSVGVSLDKLWNEATSSFRRQDGQTAIPPRIYNNFLTGYLALFSSERSVQVWNHMIQSGIKPDVNAWTAMLTGCERARDLNGVKAVWQRMIRSGIQPDIHAWTTRIHALFSLRVINDGFAAMDEMGRQWLSSEQALNTTAKNGPQASKNQPTVNTVPKPSTDVINGATSGIVKIPTRSLNFDRKAEFVRKILSWAGHFSIKPDARTYNILMNLYMSGNDYPTVFKLLQQMEAEGIEADVATYSMLIRASFDNHKFNDLPEAEQAERITSLFSELEAGGLKLNANLYSSAIDRLLKQYANFAAVRTLIDHMLSRGLIPSPHVYTSLVTQYFSQSPPNIAAVDSLCYQILSSPGTPTDKILFDRIIEGYAGVGEIGKMMAILTKMSKHGKLPGWMALTAVVQALARHGEWDRARMVVADVQRGEGVAKGGITGGMHGEKDFFRTVKSLGLVVQQVHGQAEQAWSQEAGELGAVADEAWRTQRRQPALPAKSHGVHKLDEASMEQAKQPKAHVHEDNGSVGGIPL